MSQIFISYSRKDAECAYKIQRRLEGLGIRVWIDKTGIRAGDQFPTQILDAIRDAAAFILLWTENAKESHYVGKEIKAALDQNMSRSMPILPVWLGKEQVALPDHIRSMNAIHLVKCNSAEISNLIDKIPTELRQKLGRQAQPFDMNTPLNQQEHEFITGTGLVEVKFLSSWYCQALIVGHGRTVVGNHLAHAGNNKPIICVVPQFLGAVPDGTMAQVHNAMQDQLEGQDFLALHIRPHANGGIRVNIEEQGEILDIVATTHEAVLKLVNGNRSLATLRMFTPLMSAISGSVGHRFDSFWHIQFYHFDRNQDRYFQIYDSTDLPYT